MKGEKLGVFSQNSTLFNFNPLLKFPNFFTHRYAKQTKNQSIYSNRTRTAIKRREKTEAIEVCAESASGKSAGSALAGR
jgi:hypothetical protein